MQRDEQVIEANKKAEEACTREEATSNKVKALEDQLKVPLRNTASILAEAYKIGDLKIQFNQSKYVLCAMIQFVLWGLRVRLYEFSPLVLVFGPWILGI